MIYLVRFDGIFLIGEVALEPLDNRLNFPASVTYLPVQGQIQGGGAIGLATVIGFLGITSIDLPAKASISIIVTEVMESDPLAKQYRNSLANYKRSQLAVS